jgi:AraC-like DNA-binding protein
MTTAHDVRLNGSVRLVGIRFRPGGAHEVFGVPLRELQDESVSVSRLSIRFACSVPQLSEVNHLPNQFNILSDALRYRLASRTRSDPDVLHAIERLTRWQTHGAPAIADVARAIGVSERSLERRFADQVGLNPIQYRRLVRFRRALSSYALGRRSWSDIALTAGFSDQSHLAREFQRWTGTSPSTWASSQSSTVGFVQDGELQVF